MKKIYFLLLLLSFLPSLGGVGGGMFAQTVDKTLCSGTSFTINSTAYPSTASTYQWLENGQVIAGATAADYTIAGTKAAGVYTYIRQSKSVTCVDWQSSNAYTVEVYHFSCLTVGTVTWAGVNVDSYQAFAARPDMYTQFYQWNRTTAYLATGSSPSPAWTETSISDATWSVNPCPEGWRLPTKDEYVALDKSGDGTGGGTGSTWVAAGAKGNAVAGCFYGPNYNTCTMSNLSGCIFLPAVGYRNPSNGSLYDQGSYGFYWSSVQINSIAGYSLAFYSGFSNPGYNYDKAYGFSVRCVR